MGRVTMPNDGDQYQTLSEGEMRSFVERHEWVYAKSMPRAPHEYLLEWRADNRQEFFSFVMTIRRFGYDERYRTMTIRYYDLDIFKYWTMGEFTETTYVLNRARIYRPGHPRLPSAEPFKPVKGVPARWRKKSVMP